MVQNEKKRLRLVVPDIDGMEISAIQEVLKSGYLVQGEKVEQFEQLVTGYVGIKNAIATTSGTSALHLSLLALGIGDDDEVIVPNFTFPATANVVEIVGAKPILVDIDINTFNLDINIIEENITSKTKAIMPVHLFGQAADMDPICKIAKKYDLKIIEDAACALGSEYNGKKCGSFGDVGCFSFHPRKAITTGEGGMVVTDDDKIAHSIRLLRNHGMLANNGMYDFILPGFNYRMTDLQGAIGIAQMKKLNDIISKKMKIAKMYDEYLENVDWIRTPGVINKASHIYQSYVILLDKKYDRISFMSKLKEKGIENTIGTYALHMLSYYNGKYGYKPNDFPNTREAFEKGVTIPLYSGMTREDVQFVVENIKDVFMND